MVLLKLLVKTIGFQWIEVEPPSILCELDGCTCQPLYNTAHHEFVCHFEDLIVLAFDDCKIELWIHGMQVSGIETGSPRKVVLKVQHWLRLFVQYWFILLNTRVSTREYIGRKRCCGDAPHKVSDLEDFFKQVCNWMAPSCEWPPYFWVNCYLQAGCWPVW